MKRHCLQHLLKHTSSICGLLALFCYLQIIICLRKKSLATFPGGFSSFNSAHNWEVITSVWKTAGNKTQPSCLLFPPGILWGCRFLPQSNDSQEFCCSLPLPTYPIYSLMALLALVHPRILSPVCKDECLGLLFREEAGVQPHHNNALGGIFFPLIEPLYSIMKTW